MKPYFVSFVLLLAATAHAKNAAEGRRLYVVSLPDMGVKVYIDQKTVTPNTVTVKMDFKSPQQDGEGKSYAYAIEGHSYQCSSQTVTFTSFAYYTREGKLVTRKEIPPSLQQAYPAPHGTIRESILQAVCK